MPAPHAPPPPTAPTQPWARWGLLAVALIMDAALVGAAVAGWVGAREGAAAVATASGMALLRTLHHDELLAGEAPQEAVEAALAQLRNDGATFLGVAGPGGVLLASAGTPAAPLGDVRPLRFSGPPEPVALGTTGRYRLVVPLRRGPPQRGRGSPQGWGAGRRPRKGSLVFEFEPVLAHALTARALTTLLISLAAAAILLGAAALAFRLSRRAAAAQAQLAGDRQLRALGQMSAVLGHELRNPLASLKGHAQLVLERLPEEHRARRGAERVVAEATRLEALTSQVLDFARTGELERRPTSPAALARAVVEASDAEPVVVTIPDGVPDWPLDRPRLERVLVNLLDNARKASPDGQPVELSLSAVGGRLLVEVADRGGGIEPGDEELVFEPFYTRRAKGTGLGLALARRIVEAHGGRITAANRPGGGAVIRLELPGQRSTADAGDV